MYYVTTCYQQKSTILALVLEKWQVVIFYMHSENTQGLWLDKTCLRILHNRRDIDYKVSSVDIRIFIKIYGIRINKYLISLGIRKSLNLYLITFDLCKANTFFCVMEMFDCTVKVEFLKEQQVHWYSLFKSLSA